MKINKTLIILSFLLIFCISLSAVSAEDNADIGVNDINNDDVATVKGSVNVDEVLTVNGEIHKSSEIWDNIKSATGTYNITYDYQIDKTWEITNNNVIIEGNNHTIYGNGNQAFRITGGNITIKNLNFMDCNASRERGGAILFLRDGFVSNCNFVNCSSRGSGGAVFFWENSVVDNCSFVNCNSNVAGGAVFFSSEAKGSVTNSIFIGCSARSSGGAIDMKEGSVHYCIFENNTAFEGNAIYTRSWSEDAVDFNFFGLQNNVAQFPIDLISGAIPNNWVVLDIVNSSGEYVVKFVVKYGPDLTNFMPNYNANLTIDGVSNEICIKNNSFKGTLVDGNYLLTSLNTGNTLASGIRDGNYDMNVSVEDVIYGQEVIINVTLPNNVTGTVTLFINNSYITKTVKDGKVSFNLPNLNASSYDFSLNYFGDNVFASKIVNGSFNVKKYPSKLNVSADDVPYLSDVNVILNLDALNPSGNFTYYLNGKEYAVRDVKDLSLIIPYLYGGFYSLVVEYSGDSNNLNSSASCNFTVIRSDAYVIGISANNITVGEVVNVVVTLPAYAFGYVELYINDKYYGDAGIRDSISKFYIPYLDPNTYIITVVYNGDDKYCPSNASVNVTVFDIPEFDIDVNASGIYDDYITGSINETYNGTITFTIGGNNFTGKVVDGKFNVNIKGIDAKTYEDVYVRFVSDDGDFIGNAIINLTISPKNIDLNGFINNASSGTNLTGIVVTGGKTGKVNVTINGVVYTGIVDSEGHFILNGTDSLVNGNYDNVLVNFVSDDSNCFGNMTVSFTIIDAPTIDNAVVSGNYSQTVSFNITIYNAQSGDVIVLHLLNGTNITGNLYVEDGKVEFTTVLPFACNGIATDVICVREGVGCAVGTVTWNINKLDTNISFVPTNVTTGVGNVNVVEIIVIDSYDNLVTQGKIKVTGDGVTLIDSEDGIYDFVDGKVTIKFKYDVEGDYKLNIKYLGGVATNNTDNYNNSTKDLSVSVLSDVLNTYIVSDYNGNNSFEGKMGKQLTLNFTVYDKNGNLVNGGNLSIMLNGKIYTAQVINGHVSITNESFIWNSTGLYAYVINYISDNVLYANSFNFTNINILKVATHIEIEGSINDTNNHLVIKVLDEDGANVTKGTIYYVSPDGIGHYINVNGTVIDVDVSINRTGKYVIAVSYIDLDGDFLYSEADFSWDVQRTDTLIKVTKNGVDVIVTINVGDELGNVANGKVDLFVNGKLMYLDIVNGVGSANIGACSGPIELTALFTGENCLSSSDKVIVEFVNVPENAIDNDEIEGINSLETDLDNNTGNNTEDNSTDVDNDESSDENSVKKSFISGIPMEHTAIPVLALLLVLLTLPIIRRRK